MTPDKLPKDWEQLYLVREGQFFMYYIIAHYLVYVLQKIVCICITNNAEMEYEKEKSLMINKVETGRDIRVWRN